MVREFYLITLILSKSELIRAVSEKKKRSCDFHRNSLIIKVVVGDGFDGGRKPDVREHRSPKGEKRKATTLKESTPGCEADG